MCLPYLPLFAFIWILQCLVTWVLCETIIGDSFTVWSIPGGSDSKESTCNAGDLGSIPGSGRSPGEGNGNPLQHSCWRTPWTEATVRGGLKESDITKQLTLTTYLLMEMPILWLNVVGVPHFCCEFCPTGLSKRKELWRQHSNVSACSWVNNSQNHQGWVGVGVGWSCWGRLQPVALCEERKDSERKEGKAEGMIIWVRQALEIKKSIWPSRENKKFES